VRKRWGANGLIEVKPLFKTQRQAIEKDTDIYGIQVQGDV